VHLEGDILGKYVEKFLRSGHNPKINLERPDVTQTFLTEHGW
jgi:riboflavin synthase